MPYWTSRLSRPGKVSAADYLPAALFTGLLVLTGCGQPQPPAVQSNETAATKEPGSRPFVEPKFAAQARAQAARPKPKKDEVLPGARQSVIFIRRAEEDGHTARNHHFGLLARELLCQAFLLSAREEFGLGTRDTALREALPANWPDPVVEIGFQLPFDGPGAVQLRFLNGKEEVRSGDQFELPGQTRTLDYARFVEAAEALSRTSYPVVLRKLGYAARANRQAAQALVPADTEKRLGQMTFTAQFAAVRELHAALRSQGESPQLLGALARAYANLGLLTEYHWSAAHKVYKARSLLYAQRMVARAPQSPWPLWHRAYAKALVGLHAAALADLDQARVLERDVKRAESTALGRPVWVDWIEAACRFDRDKLAAVPAREPLSQFAQLLWFFTVADPQCEGITVAASDKLLKQNPACFRVHEVSNETGGVGHKHEATVAAIEAFSEHVPGQVARMPGLPAAIGKLLQSRTTEPVLVRALVEAGKPGQDTGELSWTVLGRLMEETRFVQGWRRLAFMRDSWSVPVDEFLPVALELTADHPYRTFLQSYGLDPRRQQGDYQRLLASIDLHDLDGTRTPLIEALSGKNIPNFMKYVNEYNDHQDAVHQELVRELRAGAQELGSARLRAQTLIKTSPHSPFAMAAMILYDWASAREHVAQWDKTQGRHPTFLRALVHSYYKTNQWDSAVRCVERYLQVAPDIWGYWTLAQTYKEQGDMERWAKTLEACLKLEDYGLNHAAIRKQLAQHYMARKEWKKAQPYAEAAAATWAGWAMTVAAQCAEGLGEWERAAVWMQRLSERYPDGQMMYYFWCKRTGHGSLRKAQELAQARIRDLPGQATAGDLYFLAAYQLLENQPAKALEAFEQSQRLSPDVVRGILIALLAEDQGKKELRDKTLQALPIDPLLMKKVPEMLREAVRSGKAPDVKAVDAELRKCPSQLVPGYCYVLGRILQKYGKPDQAREYYEACARDPEGHEVLRALAATASRQLASQRTGKTASRP